MSANMQKAIAAMGLRVRTIEEVPESFSSEVSRLRLADGEQVYLKIPYSKVKWEREAEALRVLQNQVPVPQLLEVWGGNTEVTGALLLSAIDGEALNGEVSVETAADIGRSHAELHTVGSERASEALPDLYDNWEEFRDRQFYGFAEDVKGVIPDDLFDWSLKHYEKLKRQLPPADGPAFIHMDLRPANIIVKDGRVTGLIDFESSRFGSTEMDFTKLDRDIFSKHPGTRAAFEKGYGSVRPLPDLDAILPFYRFTDAFNSIGWAERRGIEEHRAFFESSLQELQAVYEGKKNWRWKKI